MENLETYKTTLLDIIKIGNEAVQKAKEDNKKYGILEVIEIAGKRYELQKDNSLKELKS